MRYRYNFDYISKKDKIIILKSLLNTFTLFYQTDDYKKEIVNDCKNFINQVDKLIFARTKKKHYKC